MVTCNGRQFATTAIARRVVVDGWEYVPAAAPDADDNIVGGCTWLVEEQGWIEDEDYGPEPYSRIVECGAEAAFSDDYFECAAGHEHTSMAARERLGWDYAEDEWDAAVLARGGRGYRPMGPGTHIDEREAARIMATL